MRLQPNTEYDCCVARPDKTTLDIILKTDANGELDVSAIEDGYVVIVYWRTKDVKES